jgi:hypothetical protein
VTIMEAQVVSLVLLRGDWFDERQPRKTV